MTDQVCESIQQGMMNRDQARDFVKKYDGKCSEKYIEQFCKFLSITKSQYESVVEKFVNRNLFYKENGKWKRKFEIF